MCNKTENLTILYNGVQYPHKFVKEVVCVCVLLRVK